MFKKVRVRFAPSPTGHLHIGGLRTALFNYLFARVHGGDYLLRIEDTDVARSSSEYQQSILDSFTWLNLLPDEPVVIQSSRLNEHLAVVDNLIAEKKAYRCYCSSEDLERRLGKIEGEFIKYDRHCFINPPTSSSKPFVVRFCMPLVDDEVYSFDDMIREKITFESSLFDDFIIVRSDGIPVYNLVVVLDDAWMRVTHIIRGEEHIPNTPKQIALYKACGYPVPLFAHLPMILGPGGHKLSKRDGAKSTFEYKKEGYLPDALLNYLVRLGWSNGDQELFTIAELEKVFDIRSVQKKGAIFDQAKLDWMNSYYIKKQSPEQLYRYISNQLSTPLVQTGFSSSQIYGLILIAQSRAVTVCDIVHFVQTVLQGPTKDMMQRHHHLINKPEVKAAINALSDISLPFDKDFLKALSVEHQCAFPDLIQAIRIALTGEPIGPSIFDMVALLGTGLLCKRLGELFHE